MAEIKEITPFFLTAKGLKLQAKVQTGLTKLDITRVVIGYGYLDDKTDKEQITALIHEIPSRAKGGDGTDATVDVARVYEDTGNGVAMITVIVKNGNHAPTYLREFGIMATDPDDGEIMYGYSNLGDEALPFPKYDGIAYAKYTVDFPTIIANTSDIIVNVTETVEVPAEEFDKHKTSSVIDHPDGSVTSVKLEESIELRGKPTAPTADTDTNNTQIATTAFVQTVIRDVLSKSVMMAPAKFTCSVWRSLGEHGTQQVTVSTRIEDIYGNDISGIYADYVSVIYGADASATSSILYTRFGYHKQNKYKVAVFLATSESSFPDVISEYSSANEHIGTQLPGSSSQSAVVYTYDVTTGSVQVTKNS